MSTTDPETQTDVAAAKPNPALERMLVFIVAFLGLALLAGLAAVVLRIFYLSSRPSTQQAAERPAAAMPERIAQATLPPEIGLPLPQGAAIRSVSLNDDRVAVHYDAPAGPGIAIVDIKTGEVVARVGISTLQVVPGNP